MKIGVNGRVALKLAELGIPVFPCQATGRRAKQPLTKNGHHDATTDADQIRKWWSRWPNALVGVPTGPPSDLWVLDVDGEIGRQNLNAILAHLGVEKPADLTPCISRTPSGGLHLIFRLQPGETPGNRAHDIGVRLDTRGVKKDGTSAGYFIAAGSTLPDGRRYQSVDAFTLEPDDKIVSFASAAPAPRELLYLATFSAAERAVIESQPDLRASVRDADPGDWIEILRRFQTVQRSVLAQRMGCASADAVGLRAQALHDLDEASRNYSLLQDDRRNSLFKVAARLARYVAHQILNAGEVRSSLVDAAIANGAVREYGLQWADGCINRALALGRNDPPPLLARRFRSVG
jgi:putative DNA primase/helicase